MNPDLNRPSLTSRRRFLFRSTSLLVAAPLITLSSVAHGQVGTQGKNDQGTQGNNDQGVQLTAGDHNLFRVRMSVEAEGNVNVPRNPLVSRKSATRLPIKSEAVFDYEERYHRVGGTVTTLERYYHQAQSNSQLNRGESTLTLRPSVKDTVIHRDSLPEMVYATEDYFRREELDLLRSPVCSSAVDELLPLEPIEQGSSYQPDQQAIASVLNLSSVDASDVMAEVVSISDRDVKLQLRGKIDGSVDGVPTVIRVVGKLTFDRLSQSCTWLAMAMHETREIGIAEPGFDVAATVKMIRKPLDQTMALPAEPRRIASIAPPERLYVDLRSEELGISALMDRRWRVMSDLSGSAMMRMIDQDRSIAQCDFRSLVALEPGAQLSLEAFQQDVRRTLGEQLTEMIEADQRETSDGLTVLRVSANGAVQGVPIHWIMLHFSDATGRRVQATFTMEGDRRTAFAGSDAQLASSMRFLSPPNRAVDTEPDSERRSTETPAPGASKAEKEVAAANLGEDSDGQVQSASDLQ